MEIGKCLLWSFVITEVSVALIIGIHGMPPVGNLAQGAAALFASAFIVLKCFVR